MLSEYGCKELNHLWNYIYNLENIINESNKKLIIWGLGKSGKFLSQLLAERTKIKVNMYIDEKIYIYSREIKIRRSSVLNYIDNSEYLIISTVKSYDDVKKITYDHGYEDNKTIFDAYSIIGESYLDSLRNKYPQLDFGDLLSKDNRVYDSENMQHQAVSFPNIDRIFDRIGQIQDKMDIRYIDLGCGNGASMVLAKMFGIENVSGVELVKELYDQAIENMSILGLDCNVLQGNIVDFNFDDYNFIYMYNSVRGNVFKQTIKNIEESFNRIPRDIYIYYGNPFEHNTLVANGVFKLIEQFETDFYDPLANLYIAKCSEDDR